MKKIRIGDILELQRGYDLPKDKMSSGSIPVVGSNGIVGTHNKSKGTCPCITIGRSGSIGKVHFYTCPVWVHNTALYIKDYKGNDPLYLYYFLQNLHLDQILKTSASVIPSLDRKNVHNLTVPFTYNRNDQKLLISVLRTIDLKINLNNQINHNLPILDHSLEVAKVRCAA